MNNEETDRNDFYILPSAINEIEQDKIHIPELDEFEILESAINTMTIKIENPIAKPKPEKEKIVFNHREFLADVKEQMHDLGLDASELAQITYIPNQRIKGFLHSGVKLKEPEIREIKKKLYISS